MDPWLEWLATWMALVAVVLLVWAAIEWPDRAKAAVGVLHRAWDKLGDLGRAAPLLLLFAVTFAVVSTLNPMKAGLALWGVSKIALGGYVGYWADRLCFRPEDRPHRLTGIAQGTAWKRRALIIAAAILAGGLIP